MDKVLIHSQTFYVDFLGKSPSAISWIGAVQIFLLFFVGTFSGRATDYGLFKLTYGVGAFLQTLGVFMTSLSTKYWQLFLAQGVCIGLGDGLVFCPAVSLLSTYFTKKRGLAIAIAASGTATGGLIYPAIAEKLLPTAGFAWTVRTQGFVMLAIHLVAFTFIKTRLPPRKAGALVEWSAFKDTSYSLFAVGMFLAFWGLYFAFYYIGSFGRNVIGISQQDSINLLLIINGVGLFGRLIPNYLSDRYFGPLNSIIPFVFCAALLLYCWAAVTSHAGLIAFAVVYGFFASGIQSLFPATLSSLTKDLRRVGVRIGMTFTVVSFATLTGPPLAGALVERNGGGYLYAQMFAGTTMMCGAVVLVLARLAETGKKVTVRI